MAACEKCWQEASARATYQHGSVAEHYRNILKEHQHGDIAALESEVARLREENERLKEPQAFIDALDELVQPCKERDRYRDALEQARDALANGDELGAYNIVEEVFRDG